jgi:hypothetical protein
VERSEASLFDRQLDYDYLSLTICRLIELEDDPLESLKNCAFISSDVRGKDRVNEETADKVIAKAVRYLNHQEISRIHDYEFCEEPVSDEKTIEEGSLLYKDDTYYLVEKDDEGELVRREAGFDEVFESLDLEESSYIDFEKAIIIPYGEEYEDTSYINEYYTLLSSNDSHVFHNEGFRALERQVGRSIAQVPTRADILYKDGVWVVAAEIPHIGLLGLGCGLPGCCFLIYICTAIIVP